MKQSELQLTGQELRDIGTARVIANNEEWVDRFNTAAERILRNNAFITSEDVILLCGMPPGHPSAVEAAMRAFAKAHNLKKTSYTESSRPSCHGAIIAVWARKP